MPSTQISKPRSVKGAPRKTAAPGAERQEPAAPVSAMSDAEKRETLIRVAAYAFYERRGYVSGHELEDWLEAEMEVNRQLAAAQEASRTK